MSDTTAAAPLPDSPWQLASDELLVRLGADRDRGLVVLLNSAIGFVMEPRAARSMGALRALGGGTMVCRDGRLRQLSTELVVPGDIVVNEGGDVVTADLCPLEASKLETELGRIAGWGSSPTRRRPRSSCGWRLRPEAGHGVRLAR